MAYYRAIEGFEFHEKKVVGDYTYYIYVNKHSQILIKKIHNTTDSTRFCLTTDAFASVFASPELYVYYNLDHWQL